MGKFLIFLLLFALPNINLADDFKVNAERLITDYYGAVYNGSVVICYGNYGILTYSSDYGLNWSQKTIGDFHNIRKIIAVGGNFFGVTSNSLLKSTDNGDNWYIQKLNDTGEIVSMEIKNDKIYILTNGKILKTNFEFEEPTIFAQLNKSTSFSSITSDDDYIYLIEGTENILRFELSNGKLSKAMNIKDFNFTSKFSFLTGLKSIGTELYCVVQVQKLNIIPVGTDHYNYDNILIRSTDRGDTWEVISDGLKGTSCYHKINGEIYFIGPKPLNSLMKIEFKKCNLGNNSTAIINQSDEIKREIYFSIYDDEYKFNELIILNENIWLAVGNDKFIARTTNAGMNWELISFFKNYYIDNLEINNNLLQLSKDIVFVPYFRKISNDIYFKGFFKTTNSGATWVPQKYNPNIKIPFSISQYHINKDGKGVFLFYNSTSQFYTTDYGETFQSVEGSISGASFQLSDRRGLNLGDRFIFKYTDAVDRNRLSIFYITNFERLIDSVKVDSISFKNILMSEDSAIYAVGLYQSDFQEPDADYQYGHYKYRKYFIYKSEDKGKTWVKHSDELPIEVERIQRGNTMFYYDFTRSAIYFNRKIIIPYGHYQGKSLFCIYDIKTKKTDSVVINRLYNNSSEVFFIFGDRLCYFSLDKKINYTPQNEVGSEWFTFQNELDRINDDVVISYSSENDYCFYSTGKFNFSSSFGGLGYKVNVVKIQNDINTSIGSEFDLYSKNNLIDAKPYPLPSNTGWINIQVNCEVLENDADIIIFDNFGNKLPSSEMELLTSGNNKALLKWHYGQLPSGIYYLNIGNGINKKVVPVIISK